MQGKAACDARNGHSCKTIKGQVSRHQPPIEFSNHVVHLVAGKLLHFTEASLSSAWRFGLGW